MIKTLHGSPIPQQEKRMQHLPPAHWGTHQLATFMWGLWNPCSCCAFPDWCLQVWVGTVKQHQPQKIKAHDFEKLVWASDFQIPFICCGVRSMLCTVSKISNVEEFWRASHILSITIPKGQSYLGFPFNLAGEERQLAPSNISQKAIWLRMPGTVLFPTPKWDFTRYMTHKVCLQPCFQIRTHFSNYTAN